MTYRDTICISTDSHVTEPIELYEERVDAAYRGRVPAHRDRRRLAHAPDRGARAAQVDARIGA